jgi:glutathione peroxidase
VTSVHKFKVETIIGEPMTLASYKGKVLLIVNVASKCGFTYHYEGLQKLYLKYRARDFVVLGFPSNDFLSQEPGSNEEIQQFCRLTYGVEFPMFSKISVKGSDKHPLYQFLTDKKKNHGFGGRITWNFNKFLVDRNGIVIGRFGSRTKPMDPELVAAIEQALSRDTSEDKP